MRTMASNSKEIVETLRAEIEAGKYLPPSPFPSVTRLKQRFGVAHLTAVKVLDTLKKQGLIVSRHGSGSFVCKRQPRRIGVMVPAPTEGEFYPYICNVVSHVCQTVGHSVLFADISGGQAQDVECHIMRQAEALVSERVMGVIFHPVDFCASAERINMAVLDVLRAANIPVVMLDCGAGYHSFDCVGVDNVQIGWNLAEHVVSNGAKRILFVYREMKSGRGSPNAHLRLLGLRNYVMDHPGTVFVGECGIRSSGRLSLASALKRLKPDALVCTSDYVAALAIKYLSATGTCAPCDILVTGVNDIGIAALTNPPITTIRQPCAEIAQAAVETLEWRLLNPSAAPRRILVSAPLVVRESTTLGQK